jgi:YCII-related domain
LYTCSYEAIQWIKPQALTQWNLKLGENHMPNFSFTYYTDPTLNFEGSGDGNTQREKFQAWFKGLGDIVVIPNTPFGVPKTVSADGVLDNARVNRLTGFCIVKAESIDKAIEMAKGCPFLEIGTLDVAEVFEM